jgi:hypothetical protein
MLRQSGGEIEDLVDGATRGGEIITQCRRLSRVERIESFVAAYFVV